MPLLVVQLPQGRGVIPGGAGGATAPQLLANNTFFGFSHNIDRKVASEVVLMGSFMSVIYGNVRSNCYCLLFRKNCRIMNIGGLRGGHFGHGKMMCIC